jgi:hypothetical protein
MGRWSCSCRREKPNESMAGAGGKSGTSLAWIYFNRPTSLRLQGPDHFAKDCGSPRSRSARLFMWHRLLPHAAPVLTKHPASVDRVGGRRCSSWGSRRKSRQSGSHPVGFVAQRRGGRTRVRSGADGQSRMAPAGRYVERLGVV